MSLFSELKRRSVLKVAAAYVVAAWIAVQAASTILPAFEVAPGVLRAFILVLMLGFPVTIVISWLFDWTPGGVKVEPKAGGGKLVAFLAAVLAAFALGWYFSGDLPDIGGQHNPVRLAVLPLSNLSPDPEMKFFAEGLHDDLLTALTRLQNVDVISRTTMLTFRNSPMKLGDIAAEIDATHVMEGSVRRDAERIRLTLQLIEARTDTHVWADTLDRPLAEAPALQSLVAREIAGALGVELAEGSSGPATTVAGAYDLFLKARLAEGPEARVEALKLLDAALVLDPGFTLARATRGGLACHVIRFDEGRRAELAPRAHADIVQARSERPDMLEVDVADAFCTYYVDWKIPEALAIVESVLAREPNHPDALMLQAWLLRRFGRFEEGLESLQRRLNLDPNNPVSIAVLTEHMLLMGHYRELIEMVEAELGRLPGEQPGLVADRIGAEYAMTGDRERALAVLERLRDRTPAGMVQEFREYFLSLGTGPTAEGLAEAAARAGDWDGWVADGVTYPVALDLAMDADYLDDVPQRDRLLAQASDMLASQKPANRVKPGARLFHARLLALKGDHVAAIAEVEQVLAEARDVPDLVERMSLDWLATYVLARAGAKARAVELLEAIHAVPYRGLNDTRIRDDVYLRKLLGDEPRYQALIAEIEANFEVGRTSLVSPR